MIDISDDENDIQPPPTKKRKKAGPKKNRPKKAVPKKAGPKIKNLKDLKSRDRLLIRTQDVYDLLLKYCVQEKISMTFLCAIMARRACNTPSTPEHYSKKFGKVFDQIARGEDPSEVKKFSVDHSLAMQVYLKIGRLRYINLKQYMSGYVCWINSDLLYNRRNELVPLLKPTHNQGRKITIGAVHNLCHLKIGNF